MRVAAGGCGDGDLAAVKICACSAAPRDFNGAIFLAHIGEGVKVPEVCRIFRREDRTSDDDSFDQQRRDGVKSLVAVIGEAKAV